MKNIDYPTLDEVKAASHIQLASWHRYLPSPGLNYIHKIDFNEKMTEECMILELIEKRLDSFGGMTIEISKKIGWDQYNEYIK